MATPGYRGRLFILNRDGSETIIAHDSVVEVTAMPEEQVSIGFTGTVEGTIESSEGARKSLYFFLLFPRPGHVNKRGPWHRRLPRQYLTRKERRRLRRLPWTATHEGLKHLARIHAEQRRRKSGTWWPGSEQ